MRMCPVISHSCKAVAALAPEVLRRAPSCAAGSQAVFVIAEFPVKPIHNMQERIEPYHVGECKGAYRVVGSQNHRLIDVGGGSYAFSQGKNCFVEQSGAEDAIDRKPRGFLDFRSGFCPAFQQNPGMCHRFHST